MIEIPLKRSRLLAEALAGLAFGAAFVAIAVLAVYRTDRTVGGIIAILLGALGLMFVLLSVSPMIQLLRRSPALRFNDLGISAAVGFGKYQSVRWDRIETITISRKLEANYRYRASPSASSNYLEVFVTEPNGIKASPALSINERRCGENLEDVIRRLSTIDQAKRRLSEDALSYRYKSDFQRLSLSQRIFAFIALAVVAIYIFKPELMSQAVAAVGTFFSDR